MIKVNMEKAIEIKKTLIRQEREEKFKVLDAEFMKAVEMSDAEKQKEIAEKKQALRDATVDPAIINAKTPEELKNAIPQAFVE